MNEPASQTLFGGFSLNGMKLALPLTSLREAVPVQSLTELPTASHGIVGGLNYHDTLLPVLDLCKLLDKSRHSDSASSILVVVIEGFIFGLLTDAVSGIFSGKPDSAQQTQSDDLLSSVFAGTVARQDDGGVVSLLSLEKLVHADHFPRMTDPQPERQSDSHSPLQSAQSCSVDQATVRSMMVVKCGQYDIAIDTLSIHTTIASFTIEKSPLAVGHCLGVVRYMGMAIPVIDFHAFCGFGQRTEAAGLSQPSRSDQHAFMVSNQHGKLAFLIDQIIDMASFDTTALHALPEFALSRPELFAGAIERTGLPSELVARLNSASECLMIDSGALMNSAEVISFTATNAPGSSQFYQTHATDNVTSAHQLNGTVAGPAMLLYRAGLDFATEISQISAILPYTDSMRRPDHEAIFIGLIQHRNQTIPLIDLSRLQAGRSFEVSSSSCVLVVRSAQHTLGFLVESLNTIASSCWQPEISQLGKGAATQQGTTEKTRLALFRIDGKEKMLPVLDLAGLKQRFRLSESLSLDH